MASFGSTNMEIHRCTAGHTNHPKTIGQVEITYSSCFFIIFLVCTIPSHPFPSIHPFTIHLPCFHPNPPVHPSIGTSLSHHYSIHPSLALLIVEHQSCSTPSFVTYFASSSCSFLLLLIHFLPPFLCYSVAILFFLWVSPILNKTGKSRAHITVLEIPPYHTIAKQSKADKHSSRIHSSSLHSTLHSTFTHQPPALPHHCLALWPCLLESFFVSVSASVFVLVLVLVCVCVGFVLHPSPFLRCLLWRPLYYSTLHYSTLLYYFFLFSFFFVSASLFCIFSHFQLNLKPHPNPYLNPLQSTPTHLRHHPISTLPTQTLISLNITLSAQLVPNVPSCVAPLSSCTKKKASVSPIFTHLTPQYQDTKMSTEHPR